MQRRNEESAPNHRQLEQDASSLSSDCLAWLLADTLRDVLPERTVGAIYVHLGCRHYRRAIAEALRSAVETGTPISDVLARAIDNWLNAYDGHPDQERLTQLLAKVARQTGGDAVRATVRDEREAAIR